MKSGIKITPGLAVACRHGNRNTCDGWRFRVVALANAREGDASEKAANDQNGAGQPDE